MLPRLFAVNVTGAFVCAREAVRRMSTSRGGARRQHRQHLVEGGGASAAPSEWVHYAASKGAIDTMTTGLSKELAAEGIRVNAVRPGLIESDFHLHAPPGRVERMAPIDPDAALGHADEVAAAVAVAGVARGQLRDGRVRRRHRRPLTDRPRRSPR